MHGARLSLRTHSPLRFSRAARGHTRDSPQQKLTRPPLPTTPKHHHWYDHASEFYTKNAKRSTLSS